MRRSKRYKEKLKEWGFDKNLTHRQSKFIRHKTLRRHNEQGKKTEFRIRGSVVPQNKVERTLKAAPESEHSPTASKFRHHLDLLALICYSVAIGDCLRNTGHAIIPICPSKPFRSSAKPNLHPKKPLQPTAR